MSTMLDATHITAAIERFCADSVDNTLGGGMAEPAWSAPLVGFSRGDDPLYRRFQKEIGPFHWTPLEAFRQAFPDEAVGAAGLTVISYVLPQTAATRADQRREERLPAERWCRARHYGEAFNVTLREHLVAFLRAQGVAATAPERSPLFAYRVSERYGLASNWSERHAAFASGLGTFGLSDGLITPAGKAVRCGSVVARLALPPTSRPYGDDHLAWCLHYARGTCRVCIKRCPADAISAAGHDKERCFAYIREVTAPHAEGRYAIPATPCGLCQVAIPCEARNPLA